MEGSGLSAAPAAAGAYSSRGSRCQKPARRLTHLSERPLLFPSKNSILHLLLEMPFWVETFPISEREGPSKQAGR